MLKRQFSEKTLVLKISITILCILLLGGGCGSSQNASTKPSQSATSMTSQNEIIQLNYWNLFTGPDGKYMREIVSAFNNENQGKISVKQSTWAEEEYYNKLIPAVASGTAPEVGIIHASRVKKYAIKGILLPMNDIAIKIGQSEKDFPKELWNAGEIDDNRYSIPLDIHPLGLFYNIELLKQAGYSNPPETAKEFLEMAKACTKDLDGDTVPDQWGFATAKEMIARVYWSMLYQFGGKEVSDDGNQPAYDSPEGVKALKFLYDLTYNYKVAPTIFNPDGEVELFKRGKLAFHINGIWMLSELRAVKSLNFEIAPMPQFGTQKAVWADSHNIVLFKQRRRDNDVVDASSKFIKYLLDNSIEWAKAGQVPARNDVRNSYEFKQLKYQQAFAIQEDFFSFPTKTANHDAIWSPITDEITNALMDRKTVESALKAAAKTANVNLANNK